MKNGISKLDCLHCGQAFKPVDSMLICQSCFKVKEQRNSELEVVIKESGVVGQERAKRDVSDIVMAQVYRRNNSVSFKSNLLILGNSGTGKTQIVTEACVASGVPFHAESVPGLSPAAFAGHRFIPDLLEDVVASVQKPIDEAIEAAQYGVIFLDEIDKIAANTGDESSDSKNKAIQNELLKLTDTAGFKYKLKCGKIISTENILFIGAGAFQGVLKDETTTRRPIGFYKETKISSTVDLDISIENLESCGISPELLGRFSIITRTSEPTNQEVHIIAKTMLNDLKTSFSQVAKIDFDDETIELITSAYRPVIGVRSIIAEISKIQNKVIALVSKGKKTVKICNGVVS